MARQPETVDVEPSSKPSAVAGVGQITQFRLKRDLGITTVRGVAEADIDELQKMWGVGPVRGGRMKGRSQGIINKFEEELDAQWENRDRNEKRVAVVAGQDELDQVSVDYADTLVDLALEEAGVDLDDYTRVGFVNTNSKKNEMGGSTISDWYDRKVVQTLVRKMEFTTPWTKYAYYLWDEWGYDEKPDIDRPKLGTDIPFDVARGEDVEAWMAPAERTRNMVDWADQVVIVADGEYADTFRAKCEQRDVDCTTVFDIEDGEVGAYEETDLDEPEQYVPPEEEQYHGGNGARAGSAPDLEDDPHLTQAPNDSLEQRPEVDDETAGGGVGSANWDDVISPGR